MTELKACPFCGGKAHMLGGAFFSIRRFVECRMCGARTMDYTSGDWRDADRMATIAWNRRAEDEVPLVEVDDD